MRLEITLNDTTIPYTLRRYKRSKHINISLGEDNVILVTAPYRVSLRQIEDALRKHSEWILRQLHQVAHNPVSFTMRMTKDDYLRYKDKAFILVSERVGHFNQFYNFDFKRISIRNQKTRWGSCSTSGTLSFNFKILFLPPQQRDYIIVHELCHLKEFNHSSAFWALVEKTIPEYKILRRQLKNRQKVL